MADFMLKEKNTMGRTRRAGILRVLKLNHSAPQVFLYEPSNRGSARDGFIKSGDKSIVEVQNVETSNN